MAKRNAGQPRNPVFGQRKDIRRIIFAKGDEVTSVTIHPVAMTTGVIFALLLVFAYLGATFYLIFRDDFLTAARIRQVSMQNAYEDQLANLRIEIDRIASRQMLDQRSVENKIDRLLGLRASLEERNRMVEQLSQTASAAGILIRDTAPSPRPRPPAITSRSTQANATVSPLTDPIITSALVAHRPVSESSFLAGDKAGIANQIRTTTSLDLIDLNLIEKNLYEEEQAQAQKLRLMAQQTLDSSKNIAAVIHALGFKAPAAPPHTPDAIGGPFEEFGKVDAVAFDNSVLALEENLDHLTKLKKTVQRLPLARPLKTGTISSSFGRRVDPFLNRYAMHSGLDFKAPEGTPVYATGPGKVTRAEWTGGYGRLVEIEHQGGIKTRYGHLSRIDIAEGAIIAKGQLIGRVGSTGRSTGAHLHYETRLEDQPINPGRFLKAGISIHSLL